MSIINYLQNHMNVYFLLVIILGLIFGSFINVVIYRLPVMLKNDWRDEALEFLGQKTETQFRNFNLLTPRSHCPRCKIFLPPWCNIPVFSYLFLRGKCYYCQEKINWRYPFIELLTAAASYCIAFKFGISFETLALLLLTWGLIALFFIDLDYQILPDEIVLTLLWLGLLLNTQKLFTTPEDAILGASVAYLSLWFIAFVFKKVRKIEGMGHGDFKLFAVFGAWFGVNLLLPIILSASLLGSIAGIVLILKKKYKKDTPMPFGPFIVFAGWLAIFFGHNIVSWYLNFIVL
jgi:leader peptidase (prepilin peptidase) / N-methyltransferase